MNSKTKEEPLNSSTVDGMPDCPTVVIDRFGYAVDLRPDRVCFNDPASRCTMNGVDLSPFSMEIKTAVKLWLGHCVAKNAPETCHSNGKEVALALRRTSCPKKLREMNLAWWRDLRHWHKMHRCEWRLTRIRAWYMWLDDNDIDGVDEEVALSISGWSFPCNTRGAAVASLDPEDGPLTDLQFAHLHTQVANLAARGITTEVALVKLCMNLGPNAKQLALLEERDFSWKSDPQTGAREYFLDVPLAARLGVTRQSLESPERREILGKAYETAKSALKTNRITARAIVRRDAEQRVAVLQQEVRRMQLSIDSYIEKWAMIERNCAAHGIDPRVVFAT